MVLQNANNQLYSLFSRLKLANFSNMTAKSMPKSFCKILINNYFLIFERKTGEIAGIITPNSFCKNHSNFSGNLKGSGKAPVACWRPALTMDLR